MLGSTEEIVKKWQRLCTNAPWLLDQPLNELVAAGLPAPSNVCFKLFTLDDRLVRSRLGRLGESDAQAMTLALGILLGNSR